MAGVTSYPMMGYKFVPTDEELICYYLQLGIVPPLPACIVQQDIYSLDPQSLNWDYVPYLYDYERYYLVKRSQVAKSGGGGGGGEGKNANRSVGSDSEAVGFWRMSCGRDIKDCRNNVIGHCQSLNYYRYNTTTDDQQQEDYSLIKIRKKALKTQWLMHEYTLFASDDKFQEWAICRIKDQEKEKDVKEGRYNSKRRREVPQQADHTDVPVLPPPLEPPAKRPRHVDDHQIHNSPDLADDYAKQLEHQLIHNSPDLADDDDDYANLLEHQLIENSHVLADDDDDDDFASQLLLQLIQAYPDLLADDEDDCANQLIENSSEHVGAAPPPPPPPIADDIHQSPQHHVADQSQDNNDDDFNSYLNNLPPIDHQPLQFQFQSNVPVFDDGDNFEFSYDFGSDNHEPPQNYFDPADAA